MSRIRLFLLIFVSLIFPTKAQATARATGGTYTEVGGYGIHKFTGSGTFTPDSSFNVEYLIVAGGGGGGGWGGGGGGAGGMLVSSTVVTSGAKSIVVGGGGPGAAGSGYGSNGGNSSFNGLTAIGGGRGGGGPGGGGGSGGGGGGASSGGAGTSGQGYAGGSGLSTVFGGGGGAGGAARSNIHGGLGRYTSITGASVCYGGGGGGARYTSGPGSGGGCGATDGACYACNASSATANTGSGGGGAGAGTTTYGGKGGSGVVIIRYLLLPTAPTIGSATALSTSSIRWNFTDNSSDETGFRIFDTGDTQQVECASADISYCDETGLSANTQYTRKATAYSGAGNSSYSSTASKYTHATTPAVPVVNNAAATTLDVNPDPNGSPTSTEMVVYKEAGASCDGSGGSYLAANGSDNSSTPVWQAESSWATVTATGLSEQTQYSFCTKSRNGDNVETSWGSAASGTTIETDAPSISSITSVAGDSSATYYDATDDSSTVIAFTSTDGAGGGVDNCKWDTSDVAYDSMSTSCGSTSSCTVTPSGEGVKTVYIRCQDIYFNKMSSSQTVNYTIDATTPTTLSATGSSASWTNAKPTVTVSTPADALSGMNEIRYVWDSNDLGSDCSAGTTTTAAANLTSTLTEGSHILYLCASDNAGNVTTWNGAYKWDNSNPLVNITTHTLSTYKASNIPSLIQGTASDVISSVSSVAVSIYNGVNYWSGAVFDSLSQVWLAATGTTSWSYTFAPTSDGDYTLQSRSTDAANNTQSSSVTNFTYDASNPVISVSEASTPGAAGATITWTTDEIASTQLQYGVSSSYGTTTSETDTSPRVTSHSVVLSGLQGCVTYHYRIISEDTAGNSLAGEDKTFTTTGCVGSSSIQTETASAIATASGGLVTLQESGATKVSLTIPVNYSSTNADFQVKRLDKNSVILTTMTPTDKGAIGDHVYQLDAVTSLSERTSSFDEAITITMTYTAAQIAGYDESSLSIYRWDGSSWYELDSCVVDTSALTVTCTTTAFSTFVLFGEESADVSSSGATSASSDTGGSQDCSSDPPSDTLPLIYAASSSVDSVTLSFADAGQPVDKYSLVYGVKSGEYLYGSLDIGGYGVRNYVVDHLRENTKYYFRIAAVNVCGITGEWSNEIAGRTKSVSRDDLDKDNYSKEVWDTPVVNSIDENQANLDESSMDDSEYPWWRSLRSSLETKWLSLLEYLSYLR